MRPFRKCSGTGTANQLCLKLIPFCLLLLLFYVTITCYTTNRVHVIERFREKIVPWAPLTFTNGSWHTNLSVCANLRDRYFHNKDFQRHPLKHRFKPLTIYTFDPFQDWISNHIVSSKTFEPSSVELVFALIKRVPDVVFLDIGANLGVFTLQVADSGKHVIAMEISKACVQHLCASVMDNQLQDHVTIIHNGVGADHHPVALVTTLKGNHGIHFIDSPETRDVMHAEFDLAWYRNEQDWYPSVRLDDLLDLETLNKYNKLFIKMDVEGFEHKVLRGAVKFFEEKEIVGVLMEWNKHYNSKTGSDIIRTMKNNGFEAYNCEHKDFVSNMKTHPLKNPCLLLNWDQITQKWNNLLWIPAGMDW